MNEESATEHLNPLDYARVAEIHIDDLVDDDIEIALNQESKVVT
jgi:hypothetical protein